KPTRKDSQVPQPNGTTESVADELSIRSWVTDCMIRNLDNVSGKLLMYPRWAVHKELGDRLVRAAIIASSLEAKQDSGGGPRCQETMGDTIAQTRGVKKLEKKNRSRTHRLKRLYKVGLMARVEFSDNEESLGKDASKQGRIYAIDADKEITLVSVQDEVVSNDVDNEMFDVDVLGGEEVFVAGKNENVIEEVVDVAQVSTAATTVIITTKEITLA
nr:hypothetical protein [Tanacetum cinerariifolium]